MGQDMVQISNAIVLNELKQLVAYLSSKDYEQLESNNQLRAGTKVGVAELIESYPGKMTMPPDEVFTDVTSVIPVPLEVGDLEAYIIVMDLWFSDLPSDLILEAMCRIKTSGEVHLSVHNIL